MRFDHLPICLSLLFAVLGVASAATEPPEVPLWPGVAPGSEGVTLEEKWVERGKGPRNRTVTSVTRPTLTAYLPPADQATGAAVVVCAGGGYGYLAIDKEGHEVARWLNGLGVAGLVLKYRVPRPKGHVFGHAVPLLDAQRAIRLTRHRARDWRVRPDRVGIMGFSAGGHLASTAGTHFDKGKADAADPVDRLSCRPDFQLLIYPVISMLDGVAHGGSKRNLLGGEPSDERVTFYANELQVTRDTPPAFLVSTWDDGVKPENSIRFFQACRKAGVPAELHIWERGGHGYGLRATGRPVAGWPARCEEWLGQRGLLAR